MTDGFIIATVVVVYFAIVAGIAFAASKRGTLDAEDYFLGGRRAKTLVLFMALLGTNVTPFVLMGIPGLAYHHGIGVFGLNAAIVALGIPLTFWAIGYPAWRAARATKAVTPAELYATRLRSPALGVVLFVVFVVYTLPYLVSSVLGVGVAVSVLTADAVSLEVASLGLLTVTLLYTAIGGMRATMWTNVFQGTVFVGFVILAFVGVAGHLGGFEAIMARVHAEAPQLLVRGDRPMFAHGAWASWGLAISLTVIAFPHMLVRIFAAQDVSALRNTCRLYPPALVLLWLPVVMLGVWGAVAVPGLEGRESDGIFVHLVRDAFGPWIEGLCLAGVLAAVMSTVDAQFLTLSSMLSRDVLHRLRPDLSASGQVKAGRVFVVIVAAATAVLVVAQPASIFSIASFSFSGYVMLVPTLYLGLRSRSFTATGGVVSILLGNAVLLAAWVQPKPWLGILPVGWGLAAAILGAWLGSRWGEPAPDGPVEV